MKLSRIFACGARTSINYRNFYFKGTILKFSTEHKKGIERTNTEDKNILKGPAFPGKIPNISFGEYLYSRLKCFPPNEEFLHDVAKNKTVTFSEFMELTIKIAISLRCSDFKRGDVASIIGSSGISTYAVTTGSLYEGIAVLPLDYVNHPCHVFQNILAVTDPKLIFCDEEALSYIEETLAAICICPKIIIYGACPETETNHEKLETFIQGAATENYEPCPTENNEESLSLIICSSGTMGSPKPVMLSDRNLLFYGIGFVGLAKVDTDLNKPALGFSFFYWISGIIQYILAVAAGTKTTIASYSTSDSALKIIEERKPHWLVSSPAHIKTITNDPNFSKYNVSSLKMIALGGSPLYKPLHDRLKQVWGPHMRVTAGYGLTETTGTITVSVPSDDPRSVGRLVPGVEVKIVDVFDGSAKGPGEVGEIYIYSPAILKGYMRNPEATKEALEDGWFKSGDLGFYSKEGFLFIQGRKASGLIKNGKVVTAREVEDVLYEVPGVDDTVAFSVKMNGEEVMMALVVKAENSNVTEQSILRDANEKLEDHKRLSVIQFVNLIPKTFTGKIKRIEALELVSLDKK